MQSTAPVVSADGSTVYIVDRVGKVFSINAATGAKNWGTTVGAGKIGGALLLNGNDLIVGIGDTAETVTFLNTADGSKIAGFNLSNGVTDIAGIAVSDDKKTAYIPLLGGGLASVDLEKRENVQIKIEGRHDSCVAVRAVPVVECAVAIAILDAMLKEKN